MKSPTGPAPSSGEWLNLTAGQATRKFALLLPKSAGPTWDAIGGQADADQRAISQLRSASADRTPVDPGRLSLAGFSDGASYALGLGISLGNQFREIIAFSPGFVAQVGPPAGAPRIFVSHGRDDTVLPIGRTSRRLVPVPRESGYRMRYEEFAGGHTVPRPVADAAADWLLHDRRESS